MTHIGRSALADVALAHGWTIARTSEFHGASPPDGSEITSYERSATQILIAWTPQNTAVWIVRNPGNPDEQTASGPTGLITAHSWLIAPDH